MEQKNELAEVDASLGMETPYQDRYHRQKLIEHWDQQTLQDSRVAIIGNGELAHFTAASLAALGIGTIALYSAEGGEKGFLCRGEYQNSSLETRLQALNPELRAVKLSTLEHLEADILLDLTNSKESKRTSLDYASVHAIPLISASTTPTRGEMHLVEPGQEGSRAELSAYEPQKQGGFSSEILGGMITEEVRKLLMPISGEEKPAQDLSYCLTTEKRFSARGLFEAMPTEDLAGKKVLIIGAGALGNFVALGCALEGIGGIDILDFDEVEEHNLNRQLLFYDSVGKKKALALAEKIKEIAPHAEVRGLVEKLDENTAYFESRKPDLILDCVDNFATRAITNYFALRYQIPVVSGGTNPNSGQVVVYEPGQTACLDCKLNVEKALGVALQGSKCTHAPHPSVIMTNEVIGGLMVGETLKVLDKGYGAPVSKILKYDSQAPVRGGLVGPSQKCECEKPEIQSWLKHLKETYAELGGVK